MQASTDGKLDFDPTVGVTYATNRDTGDVYACGSGHLWRSDDGGATYTPFMPALPAQAVPTHSARCVITTVPGFPGFPGIFATSDAVRRGDNAIVGAGPIFYAPAGDAGWQTLAIQGTARVINSTPSTAVQAPDIWADIFTDFAAGIGEPAVGSHNWLFARIRSSYSTSIVRRRISATHGSGWTAHPPPSPVATMPSIPPIPAPWYAITGTPPRSPRRAIVAIPGRRSIHSPWETLQSPR